ncbi:MAG TPA: hypothetical protein VFU23_00560 [Gemmatimonadales bacterium]|nr:hypothetical protein [Gemmatimonadales bacterium]
MAALVPLNEAAVTGPRKAPHDAVARLAAGGAAGLYGLRAGAPLVPPGAAAWFGKPAGMSYAALDELLGPIASAGNAALWMRQMVLGPTPEFCLQTMTAVDLPPPIAAVRLALGPVWPAG